MKRGQTSIIMLLLVIMVFGALGIFLLSLVQNVSQDDYMNIYTHNILISLLRTDTDNKGNCREISDIITCAAYGGLCDSGGTCKTLASETIPYYMDKILDKKPYEWYIGVYNNDDYRLIGFGNSQLLEKKTKKWSASQAVYQTTGFKEVVYNVRIILARTSD